MTNRYAAYAHRIPGGKFWAVVRFCRDSHPAPVLDEGAKPKVFASKGEAAEECLRHVVAFMNGREIRGEQFDAPAVSVKEAKFAEADRQLFLGGGRTVQVERKEARV
jgi:hypothetical protein